MLNVAPQKERISDHLRAMAEQDDKSAASGKTGEQSTIGVGCAPGEERDSAISICAVHSTTVTAAIAEYCEDTVEKQKTLTEVLDGFRIGRSHDPTCIPGDGQALCDSRRRCGHSY